MTVMEALHEKDRQKEAAEHKALLRRAQLQAEIPGLLELDEARAGIGPAIANAACHGERDRIDELKKQSSLLRRKREELLLAHGYSVNEDTPVFTCEKCKDTGYIGELHIVGYGNQKLCDCVKSRLATAAFEETGLGKGLVGMTFENFSLQYYKGDDTPYMRSLLNICIRYADTFNPDAQSLLFMGKTGLGKTHLSAAIAGVAAKKGYRVLYETSQKLFDTYEAARFGRDPEHRVEQFESCDLLVIDDLGAECAGSYTAANFFNLLNVRLINRMPMVISTNLGRPQLEKIYGERVLSRLLGDFRVLLFKGEDVRRQSLGM